ncbi:hypothetical protein PVK06_030964 [Gossypium arboreum]|uniref:Uncharacterized protein n=1 Tax=Gossypium arboreum TaxID=29729 RepID=A0ABR0NS22_GOSAR|nr:hypothetical protein PVK06_030964 [Gossypium arboreum]
MLIIAVASCNWCYTQMSLVMFLVAVVGNPIPDIRESHLIHTDRPDSDSVRMRNDMALRETGTERKTVMAKFPKSFPLDVIGAYRIAGLSLVE